MAQWCKSRRPVTFWPDRPRNRSQWFRFLLLDLGTVVVSVSDIVTDVTVILNYWRMGYYGFAYMSFAVLCLSSFVFSIIFVGVFLQDRKKMFSHLHNHMSRGLALLLHGVLVVVLTPVGQVFPVVIWASETFWPMSNQVVTDQPNATEVNGAVVLHKPVSDAELDALVNHYGLGLEDELLLRQRNYQLKFADGDPLREYLKAQAMRHAPFVGEAITESVPQSLIQLVALIVIGQSHPNHVDWVSVVSILLSIVSIVSKSYIVSISMIRPIFSFKMLAICFDVVSLFYIFASLFLATDDAANTIRVPLLDRPVDVLSFVWMAQLAFFTVWLYVVWLVAGVDTTVNCWLEQSAKEEDAANRCGMTIDMLITSVGLLVIGTALWLPLMVVLSAMNVSFVVIVLKELEGVFAEDFFPLYSNVLKLLRGPDFMTKLQAYNLVAIAAQHGGTDAFLGPTAAPFTSSGQAQYAVCDQEQLSLRDLRRASQKSKSLRRMLDDFAQGTKELASENVACDTPPCKCLMDWVYRPFRLWVLRTVVVLTTLLYGCLSLSTLLYPPASFVMALVGWCNGGGAGESWTGVNAFQTMLFAASFTLFLGIVYHCCTVLPWYFRALTHMVPVQRSVNAIAQALGFRAPRQGNTDPPPGHEAILDFIFKRVVATYSERSGRSEADIMSEVNERAESNDTSATAYCMECLHLLGRAA